MSTPSLIDVIKQAANDNRSLPAIITPNETLNFEQVDLYSDLIATALFEHDIRQGERVALYCVNGPEFAIAYLGIMKAGAVVVPVNLLQNPNEISINLNDAGVTGLIFYAALEANAQAFLEKVDSIQYCLSIGESSIKDCDRWDEALARTPNPPRPKIHPDEDLVAILYTSGTTGKPKGAMLTHTNLVTNTGSVRQAMDWQPGRDRVLLVLPMFHAFAATVGMLTPLTSGCAFIPLPKFDPAMVANTIQQHTASLFLGVPSMYAVMLNLKPEYDAHLNSLRACVAGGASMPVEVMQQFEARFKVPIYEGDGPTECSPVTCVNPFGGKRKPGTVGLPVPNVEMQIVDDAGHALAMNEIGEIAVRGQSVMKGYWGLPEATQACFIDDWFLTGDLGMQDEEGYFSIIDRKKDMVIVNGMNVYPRMIEEVLYRFESIHEAAVIGQPDPRHGERLVAYVSLKPDQKSDSKQIRSWCREHLGSYQVPREIVILPELPKNATGKIMKRELQKSGEFERGIAPES